MLSESETRKTRERLRLLAGQLPKECQTARAIESEEEFGRIHAVAKQERAAPLLVEEARVLEIRRSQGYATAQKADRGAMAADRRFDPILAETHSAIFRTSPGWNAYRPGTVVQCTACGRSIGRPLGPEPDSVLLRPGVVVHADDVVDVRCERHRHDAS